MIWLLTILSLVGVVANIHKKRWCFLLWMFTNFCWMMIDFKKEIPEQAALFAIYFVLAIWGWFSWKK